MKNYCQAHLTGKREKMTSEIVEDSDFELLDATGSGLKGNIFKARQISLGRIVAIKIIKSEFGGDAIAHARRMAKLDPHPNVVTVHSIAKIKSPIDGKIGNALVMEWLEGQKLEDLLGQKLSVEHAKEICDGIVSGIKHFHSSGVVHSDLHPGNVMIMKDFAPKIIDADEEQYSTLNKLTEETSSKAVENDLRFCRDLVFRVCCDSELNYATVMEKSEQMRLAKSFEEIEGVLSLMFADREQDKNKFPKNKVDSEKVRNDFADRVRDGKFWGMKQKSGAILLSVLAVNETDFKFEDIRQHIPPPMYKGDGWGHLNRARSVASVKEVDGIVRSVAELSVDGRILAADRQTLDSEFHPYDALRIPSVAIASKTIRSTCEFINIFVDLGYKGRIAVSISLTNISGYILFTEDPFERQTYGGEDLHPDPVHFDVQDKINIEQVGKGLRPIFDHVWREFGHSDCLLYLENGTYSQRFF